MARKKVNEPVVPQDNIAKLKIGNKEFDIEASLGTSTIYAKEFRGKLEKPYKGFLVDDLLNIWHVSQSTITDTVSVDDDGNPILDSDGVPTHDPDGIEFEYDNPDFIGYDIDAILRIAWAMARSVNPKCGEPYKGSFEDFYNDIIHQPASLYEEASLFNTVVVELGGGIIFRKSS